MKLSRKELKQRSVGGSGIILGSLDAKPELQREAKCAHGEEWHSVAFWPYPLYVIYFSEAFPSVSRQRCLCSLGFKETTGCIELN